jgi:hypothetical protein
MRFREFKPTLFEVAMNPKALEKSSSKIKAKVGMEFEMYVPHEISVIEKPVEIVEPLSIGHIIRYFDEPSQLENDLTMDFKDWLTELAESKWENNNWDNFVTEKLKNKYSLDELEYIIKNKTDYSGNNIYKRVVDDYKIEHGDEYIDNFVKKNIKVDAVERKWVQSTFKTMEDVIKEYDNLDLEIPTNIDIDFDSVANSFGAAINKPIKVSQYYHGATRDNSNYILEPDGSLDNIELGSGLEFVSPPMPLDEMLKDLENVITWAHANKCKTDASCGLHMNVSIAGFDSSNLDYVKLVLFCGDNYILNKFDRSSNYYAKSSLKDLKSKTNILKKTGDAVTLLQQLQTNLSHVAHDVIHNKNTDHEISINIHEDYVEFRSPGGDWLNIDINVLKTTLYRFITALNIACNPEKYKHEYATKLYKILSSTDKTDVIKYFVKYSTGIISKPELVKYLKTGILDNEENNEPKAVWRVVMSMDSSLFMDHFVDRKSPEVVDIPINGTNEEQAITLAKPKFGDKYKNLPNTDFKVKLFYPK